jgi:hypothetical protein
LPGELALDDLIRTVGVVADDNDPEVIGSFDDFSDVGGSEVWSSP